MVATLRVNGGATYYQLECIAKNKVYSSSVSLKSALHFLLVSTLLACWHSNTRSVCKLGSRLGPDVMHYFTQRKKRNRSAKIDPGKSLMFPRG
jgi:hypothetical protein